MYILLRNWFKDQWWAVIGGLLPIFGGYYCAYYSAVDSFGLSMLLGYGYFLLISKLFEIEKTKLYIYAIAIGVIAGLMHLIRAEGLLWAGMIPIFFTSIGVKRHKNEGLKLNHWIFGGGLGLITYFLIMLPWFLRNLRLFGSLTARGSSTNIFLTTYNDLFHYPVSELTITRWLRLGLPALVKQRINAAGINGLSLIGVQMLIVMLPFVIVAIWKNRHTAWVKVNLFGMTVIFLFFTIIFPLAGMRGSFFHSGTSFQIFLWSMAIIGLRHLVQVLPLNKGVDRKIFGRFLGIGFLTLFVGISGVLFYAKASSWDNGANELSIIDAQLKELEIPNSEIILINDPATFHWVTGRPSIVIPSGDEEVMRKVMERYRVNYAVIQINHPPELHEFYHNPEKEEGFDIIGQEGSWVILQKVLND
jgi:hypothetical protein